MSTPAPISLSAVLAASLLATPWVGCTDDSTAEPGPGADAGVDVQGDVESDTPSCGDGTCSPGESCADCPADCVGCSRCDNGPAGAQPPEPSFEVDPCLETETIWTLSAASDRYPFRVHYWAGEGEAACEVLDLVETSWEVEVEQLGFSPPLPDAGTCGSDDAFDVFIWPGMEETYAYGYDENPDTSWDDYLTYMVIDPYGPYGGELLDVTVAHEFNHACQGADDWWESTTAFEMTATFIEDLVFDEDNHWLVDLVDFQSRPDWAFDRFDDWETWYMYSAALYLHFVREHYFDGDAGFAAEMWRLSRNPPGAEDDPSLNEPDFEDALEEILQRDAGVSFLDSMVAFARWRWYTGSRDDGDHFEEGATFPENAQVPLAATVKVTDGSLEVDPAPMFLGSVYVEVIDTTAESFELSIDSDAAEVEWVIQAVPGLTSGSDGELIDLSGGSARVDMTADHRRVLILTALPSGDYDPDERPETRHSITLELAP